MHLVDEKSRGNFKKSGYFAFGCFCLFLLEPVDAKTPDIYCIYKHFYGCIKEDLYKCTFANEYEYLRTIICYQAILLVYLCLKKQQSKIFDI